ncbi:epithelial-stromal interaction protein 1 isoform 1-T2 [Spinachia spinachia]
MQGTKVIKSRPAEATRKTRERSSPLKGPPAHAARGELKVPAARKCRSESCPSRPARDRCEGRPGTLKPSCERRSRSRSTASKTTAHPDHRRGLISRHLGQEMSPAAGQRGEPQGVRTETRRACESHRAFTVIPPNPKKRREIQRKAEAELAALEALRLSRAMAYVSIDPSSVGGCLSLEEVRFRQQQEMMEAKKKQKPVSKRLSWNAESTLLLSTAC